MIYSCGIISFTITTKDELTEMREMSQALSEPRDPRIYQEYKQALQQLFQLTRFGEKQDLSTVYALNQALGNPLRSYQSILIGGTNGKGSTTHYVHHLAYKAGYKVASFTSPHLISFRERLRINTHYIDHQSVIEGVALIFEVAQQHKIQMSFFEATWALAAWYFARQKVEYVIWEIGLGGRLDACNVCDPILSAITSIGLDHTHVLGDTLEQIASEKMAIYRKGRPALTSAHGPGLEALKKMYAGSLKVCHTIPVALHEDFPWPHQQRNVALALQIAHQLQWPIHTEALRQYTWPGRLESLAGFYLDCAHNPAAARVLAAWLQRRKTQTPTTEIHVIFGSSQDKDVTSMLSVLAPYVDRWTWVTPQYPRCNQAQVLYQTYQSLLESLPPLDDQAHTTSSFSVNHRCIDSVAHALQQEQKQGYTQQQDETTQKDHAQVYKFTNTCTVITGSCFLVGEARAYLLGLNFPEMNLFTTAR